MCEPARVLLAAAPFLPTHARGDDAADSLRNDRFAAVPGVVAGIDPTENPVIWELAAEILVIVVFFVTGLRIDDLGGRRLWRPTVKFLGITMPLTIAAVAFLGWGIAGMTVAGAILLAAVLAPTAPVLAGDFHIGPPLEGKEHPFGSR